MNEPVVFDFRPPRRGDGITSASSHPELISGDFAISAATTTFRSPPWTGLSLMTGAAL